MATLIGTHERNGFVVKVFDNLERDFVRGGSSDVECVLRTPRGFAKVATSSRVAYLADPEGWVDWIFKPYREPTPEEEAVLRQREQASVDADD